MKKKKFITIFDGLENYHLIKDVGQIPFFMHHTQQYNSIIVTGNNIKKYSYLNDEVKGLSISYIDPFSKNIFLNKSLLIYIIKNAKNINILNIFHFKLENFLPLLCYKIFNPRGKTYVKLDFNLESFKKNNAFLRSKNKLNNLILKILTYLHFQLTNVFSVETIEAKDYLIKRYPQIANKLIHAPNGIDETYVKRKITLKSFKEKENIIITVGRIGTEQKNIELLIDSIESVNLKDWKLYIIGPINDDFDINLTEKLKNKVFFLGSINDRTELYSWYNRAKVFCLTSRWEGFPIVFPEAIYFGNYIITTPVSGSYDITCNGKYGTITNSNKVAYAKTIETVIQKGFLNDKLTKNIQKFAKENYTWSSIINKLVKHL